MNKRYEKRPPVIDDETYARMLRQSTALGAAQCQEAGREFDAMLDHGLSESELMDRLRQWLAKWFPEDRVH